MSVGFGFSVGDFLATLRLLRTIIDALRESSHSTSAFRELLNELYALETALIHVKRIDLDESQHFERVALYQAAAQCQKSIDAFWSKVQKYQPHLSQGGTSSGVKDGWAKIKWAVCERGEVHTFRAEIQAHTSSIQVLMDAIQVNATTRHARNQQTQYKSLAGRIQEFSLQAMGKLSAIADNVAQNVQHSTSLLRTCAEILQTNFRVFQIVYDIQRFITQIPGQVQRRQPVYMIDAFNKESPFHLEFVRSAEALLAVLKVNFKESGCGPGMIDRGEFVIEESGTHDVIDITQSWETCFYPGQRVAMSMVFRKKETIFSKSPCPRCRTSHDGSTDEEITCPRCGIVYRRIEEIEDERQQRTIPERHQNDNPDNDNERRGRSRGKRVERNSGGDDGASILKFRRLRILTRGSQYSWETRDSQYSWETRDSQYSWETRGSQYDWEIFPAYHLSQFSLAEFLKHKFGNYDFLIQAKNGDYQFWIPRRLTVEEKRYLSNMRT